MTPAPSPATGAADRVELPGGYYASQPDAQDWRTIYRVGDAPGARAGRLDDEAYRAFAAALKPSSGAGAAGPSVADMVATACAEFYRWGTSSDTSRPKDERFQVMRRDGAACDEISAHGNAAAADDACVEAMWEAAMKAVLDAFRATIARQADDLERLRKLDEALAGLRALSERATPGEWRVETDTTLVWGDCVVDDDGYVERMGVPVVDAQQARGWSKDGQPDYERAQYNAALSAAAVNFVRAQIARPSADQREGADEGEA